LIKFVKLKFIIFFKFFLKIYIKILKLSFSIISRFTNKSNTELKFFFLNSFFYKDVRNGNITIHHVNESNLKIKNSEKEYTIIGPWLSEIGYEILYWVPFLKKHLEHLIQDKNKKFIVISRGGVKNWYSFLENFEYFEIFDLDKKKIFKHLSQRKNSLSQKQWDFSKLDNYYLKQVCEKKNLNKDDCLIIHPSVLFRNLKPYLNGNLAPNYVFKYLNHSNNSFVINLDQGLDYLKPFVAIKLYESSILRLKKNESFFIDKINLVLNKLDRKYKLVYLDFKIEDDHKDLVLNKSGHKTYSINDVYSNINESNNIYLQDNLIQNSEFLVSTYGGFCYLPSFYKKKCIALLNGNYKIINRHEFISNEILNNKIDLINLNYDEKIIKNILDNY